MIKDNIKILCSYLSLSLSEVKILTSPSLSVDVNNLALIDNAVHM